MGRNRWAWPAALAVVLIALNAAKPAVVDDTAYLLMARHVAAHPADPYGFDIFWYHVPYPAMDVLLPPVLPYWLALGISLFGENLVVLKLWLLPFALVLAFALASLLRRFARGWDRPMLAVLVLGPGILPLFSVMLDVPAAALGVAAVACFVHGCDRGRAGWVLAAGVLTALAVQTKYSMLTVPAVLVLYGIRSRRWVYTPVALGIAVGLFAGWEQFLTGTYLRSHFLTHVRGQMAGTGDGLPFLERLWMMLELKLAFFQPMLGQFGATGVGVGLAAAAALGWPRRLVAVTAVAAGAGALAVCVVPAEAAVLARGADDGPVKLDLPTAVFVTSGAVALAVLVWSAAVLVVRGRSLVRGRWFLRWDGDAWFLAAWFAVELAGYFALTPFPAARRVLGLTLVGGLVAARLASRAGRVRAGRRVPGWVAGCGVAAGVALFALDTWDALPEKVIPERAMTRVGDPGPHAVWFNGHWGFQYYCDRLGMTPVVPWRSADPRENPHGSVLRAGDWLLLPVLPDEVGFYRPYHGGAKFDPDPERVERVEEFVWDDPIRGETIPPIYGGPVPIRARGRDQPRLRVVLYRVTRDWAPYAR